MRFKLDENDETLEMPLSIPILLISAHAGNGEG